MTKQEKIREGIDRIIRHWYSASISADWMPLHGGCDASQDVVLYLASEDVVIKVDGELPYYCVCEDVYEPIAMPQPAKKDFSHSNECFLYNKGYKAGFVAVEPLIEEGL